MTSEHLSLQDRYAPHNKCFGCGPSNERGLRIKSFEEGGRVVADWMPLKHHEAFDDVLSGGIIGTLLDCHSNWTAANALMKHLGAEVPPCTVTLRYAVELKRPTPTGAPVHLSAWVTALDDGIPSRSARVEIEAELVAGGKVCATCKGTFVAVKPGHPAYHRW